MEYVLLIVATEHIAGYYEIEAADLDEALRRARRMPLLPGGAVEVRPVQPVG